MLQKIKDFLEPKLPGIVLALVAIQPLLDVFSYFLNQRGSNTVSTLLRFAMLGAAALLGFLLSGRKRVYLILYGAVALFWLAHVLNHFRVGYISVIGDTANFMRTLNFPIFALTFITILTQRPELRGYFYQGVAIAFGGILLFTALPWLMGQPVYTYSELELGVLGWFVTPSAQSAIIVLTAPFFIYWAYQTGRYPVYLACAALALALMFVTGTKLNFYSIFIVAGGFMFLFAIQLGKKSLKYVLPLVALLGLVVVFRGYSPVTIRNGMSVFSQNEYGSRIEESLENSGADEDVMEMIKSGGQNPAEDENKPVTPPEKLREKLRQSLMGVYTDENIYGWLLNNMNQRFGVYNVMAGYHYATTPSVLSDFRQHKSYYAQLLWNEQDTLTKALGCEYNDFLDGEKIYDLENDFPAIFYTAGWLGFALYMAFLGIFVAAIFRAFFREVRQGMAEAAKGGRKGPRLWLRGFWLGLRSFLTVEVGAAGMSFLLAVIAAQISGNVLRRPNVTIYFAISAACLTSVTRGARLPVRWDRSNPRRGASPRKALRCFGK